MTSAWMFTGYFYRTLIGKEMEERCRKHGDEYFFGDEKKLMHELFPLAIHEGNLRKKFDFVEKVEQS